MFNSGIKVKDLISQIDDEADVAYPISNPNYIQWLNALEQLLYSEIIQEQGEIVLTDFQLPIVLSDLDVPDGEAEIRFEDIHAVYADNVQLIKSTLTSGVIFPNTYFKLQNNLGLNFENKGKKPEKLKIIYRVRPVLKKVDANNNISDEYVMVPVEFIDLVKAKLRGEAYKIANEDSLAAKWLNDYNVLLETFKAWLSGKQSEFGM